MASHVTAKILPLALAVLLTLPPAFAAVPGDAPIAIAAEGGDEWISSDRIVVGFEGASLAALPALERALGWTGARVLRTDATLGFAVVTVDAAKQQEAIKAALGVAGVAYAKPDMKVKASFVPNDPLYSYQWGAPAVGMPAAWNVTRGSHARMVAVIDTGVDGTHPDLAANFCVDGPDFVNGDNSSMDDHGHGTHVAGTVAARLDNGVGVAGMGDSCIMALKVLGSSGGGSFADTASAIVWATDNGANVISMSLGGCPGCNPGSPVTESVQYAAANDVLVIAAAGNAGCAPVSYPAAYPEVMAVAALAPPGNDRAYFSSCGDDIEISAPGQDIISTAITSGPLSDPSGYMNLSGTSMATPHTSGIAALVWSANTSLSAADVRCILVQTADDLGATSHDPETGFGRIDAVGALASGGCVPTPPTTPTLAGRGRNERVTLSWSTAISYSGDVTGYRLYRGDSATNLSLLVEYGPETTSHLDAPLTNNVTYWYAISATNSVGESALSAPLALTPVPPQPFVCREPGDAFGNTCETAAFNFVDISATGTVLPTADDAVFEIGLPFSVPFYGVTYGTVNVSSNGFLNFLDGSDTGCCYPDLLPYEGTPNALVAGYWQDLLPIDSGDMTYETTGLPGSRIFIVQFTNVGFCCSNEGDATFQFQIHEATGAIEVHYLQADSLGYTIGIGMEDCNGTDGFNAWYDATDFGETAVRFVPGNGPAPRCVVNTPPTITTLRPVAGEVVNGLLEASGVAGDNDPGDFVESVEVAIWNESTFLYLGYANGTTNWSLFRETFDLSGAWWAQARAYDGSLYTYTDPVPFTITENARPFVSMHSPNDGEWVYGVIRAEGYAWDDEGDEITRVTLSIDFGPEIPMALEPFNSTNLTGWSGFVNTDLLAEGLHTATARAYAGNASSAPVTHEFVVDRRIDLAVVGLEIERQQVQTDFGNAPNNVNEQRMVTVTVTNEGIERSGWSTVSVHVFATVTRPGGDVTTTSDFVGAVDIPGLEPGESTTVRVAWDTTFHFGDVQVVADVATGGDDDLGNNWASKDSFVRVGGINEGVVLSIA